MSAVNVVSDEALVDLQRTLPDAQVIATDLIDSAKRLKKAFPPAAHLAAAITDILPDTHIKGADVLRINLLDQDFALLDGNFFDADADGKLDPLEVNWPKGSKYWWRADTVSPGDDGSITLNMIDRVADDMMQAKGPYKASRAQMTRAEFLKHVAAHGSKEARFHSEQLHKKEPIDPIDVAGTNPASKTKSGKKTVGLSASPGGKAGGVSTSSTFAGLTVKGSAMGQRQAANANILLNVAHQEGANAAATVAIIFAGIWESGLEEFGDNGTYAGVLSGRKDRFPNFSSAAGTTAEAKAFMVGGQGFTSALSLAQGGMSNPAAIASHAEGATPFDAQGVSRQYQSQSAWPGTAAAVQEAQAIVEAGGGAAGGGLGPGTTVETVQPYNFEIGTSSNVNESDWDGSQRIAQEVNWEYFTDGPDIYYDADTTLIKQKPTATIRRGDAIVQSWNYDWNNRNVATQFTLTLFCDPFFLRAGEVVILKGFGIDNATTAKLPGRWLVADGVRQQGTLTTQYTLVQPTKPKNEPAPQVSSTSTGQAASAVGASVGGVTNPAPGSSPGRLDMGQDGNYGKAGLIAPYDGVVHVVAGGPGWPGDGDYIWIKNNDQTGPDYTRAMYFAEGATAVVGDGSKVTAGTKIGQPVASGGNGSPGNFEIGPANTVNGDCLAKQYGLGSAGAAKMVKAFSAWLQAAGMPAPTSTGNAGAP